MRWRSDCGREKTCKETTRRAQFSGRERGQLSASDEVTRTLQIDSVVKMMRDAVISATGFASAPQTPPPTNVHRSEAPLAPSE